MNAIILTPAGATQTQSFDWGELTWFASKALGNQEDITVGRCVVHLTADLQRWLPATDAALDRLDAALSGPDRHG